MKSSVIESEQIGITDEKENRAVDFVSQEFNQDDRWVMLQYTNEGKEYQLVVEKSKSTKGRTMYETRIEKLNKTNTLVDKCYVTEMLKSRRRDV